MGKGWRRRDHERGTEFDTQPSYQGANQWKGRGCEVGLPCAQVHNLGRYTLTGRDGFDASSPDRNLLGSEQHFGVQSWKSQPWSRIHQEYNHQPVAVPRTPIGLDQDSFLARSRLLKNYLIQSINQTLRQIQQWYPEEPPGVSADEMDWQLEGEVTIPIPGEVHYVWDPTPTQHVKVLWGNGAIRNGAELEMPAGIWRRRSSKGDSFVDSGARDEDNLKLDNVWELPCMGLPSGRMEMVCAEDGS
jgi:hypothetical protein